MKRFKEPKLQPPRPLPVVIPEGTVITKCPPGTARFATGNLNFSIHPRGPSFSGSAVPRKLIRVTIVCECGAETAVMITKAKLKNFKGTCSGCGKKIGAKWSNVRRG